MATILIKDLHTSGFDLFTGEDNYLNEIRDDELNSKIGGATTPVCTLAAISAAYMSGYVARRIHDYDSGTPIKYL